MYMSEKIGQYLIRLEYLSFEQAEEVLKFQENSPHKKFGEIAIELGISASTSCSQYTRARQSLQKILAGKKIGV